MVEARSLPDFSLRDDLAKAKFVVLGQPSPLAGQRLRSLHIEHVSPADLIGQEISRRTSLGRQAERALQQEIPLPEETILAVLRRWFWLRKPDAGFVLRDFPATLLQAQVFDEWLETRGVALSACLLGSTPSVPGALRDYYHMQGCDLLAAESVSLN